MGIHETAIVDSKAELGEDVEIGPFCVIEGDTIIGDGTKVHAHSAIRRGTRLGKRCVVGHGAVLGGEPQDTKFDGSPSYIIAGDDNIFREYVTINRASGEGCATRLGDGNMLMANAHMGHNTSLGDHSVIANASALGGYVEVGSHTFIGGLTGFHQFVRVGDYVMIGGASAVFEDVPHYMLIAGGYRAPVCGLNTVGLMRAGFSSETRAEMRKAYRIIYKRGLCGEKIIAALREELHPYPEISKLIDFLAETKRGFVKGRCAQDSGG